MVLSRWRPIRYSAFGQRNDRSFDSPFVITSCATVGRITSAYESFASDETSRLVSSSPAPFTVVSAPNRGVF